MSEAAATKLAIQPLTANEVSHVVITGCNESPLSAWSGIT
jgi:hypothetical protein